MLTMCRFDGAEVILTHIKAAYDRLLLTAPRDCQNDECLSFRSQLPPVVSCRLQTTGVCRACILAACSGKSQLPQSLKSTMTQHWCCCFGAFNGPGSVIGQETARLQLKLERCWAETGTGSVLIAKWQVLNMVRMVRFLCACQPPGPKSVLKPA